uniref:Retrotransposon gag domain-containing protein n=1 Tax=Moniliophthora roreri TaxID=221103 RepID=A0A0W0EY74_MONRR
MSSMDPWVNVGADSSQGEPPYPGETDNNFVDMNTPRQLTVGEFTNIANSFLCMEQMLAQQITVLHVAPDPVIVQPPLLTLKPPVLSLDPTPVVLIKPSPKPTFNPLPTFKGKANEVDSFLDVVEDTVELQASALLTDWSKCIYLAGFLGEMGKLWYRGLKKAGLEYLDNWNKFHKAF